MLSLESVCGDSNKLGNKALSFARPEPIVVVT